MSDPKIPPDLFADLDTQSIFRETAKAIEAAESQILREFARLHPDYPDEVEFALVTEIEDGKLIVRLGVPALEVGPCKMVRVISMGDLRRGIAIHDEMEGTDGEPPPKPIPPPIRVIKECKDTAEIPQRCGECRYCAPLKYLTGEYVCRNTKDFTWSFLPFGPRHAPPDWCRLRGKRK